MECRNHPGIAAIERCDGCGQPLCYDCLVDMAGGKFCAACRASAPPNQAPPMMARRIQVCQEAQWALLLAVIGVFACYGAILVEPVALFLAGKAKKKIAAAPNLHGIGMATAAQVVAVVLLLLWVIYFVALIVSISQA